MNDINAHNIKKLKKMIKSQYYTKRRYFETTITVFLIVLSFIHLITSILASHIFVHAYPIPYTYGCRFDYRFYYSIGIILCIVSSFVTVPIFILMGILNPKGKIRVLTTLNGILSGYIVPIYMIGAYLFGIPQCMKNVELYSLSIYLMCIMNVIYLCMILYIDYILQWMNENIDQSVNVEEPK